MRLATFILSLAFIASVTAPALSSASQIQTRTCILRGTIFDQNGAVIVDARIKINSGGKEYNLVSDDEGEFRIELEDGTYRIEVSVAGFRSVRESNYQLTDKVQTKNFTLRVKHPAGLQKIKAMSF